MRNFLAGLFLLIFLPFGSLAAEPSIESFSAVYTLYKGGLKVGESELTVERFDSGMRWQLNSHASGMYALLTNKKPYSESVLQRSGKIFQLASIEVSNNRQDQPIETARFDWHKKNLNVHRKGKSKELKLASSVFDYLSIHWLSAQMTINNSTKTDFDFYRKGKLVRSTLKLLGEPEINIKEDKRTARLYEQSFKKSKPRYRSYYDLKNPMLPIKIERKIPGKNSTIMLFERFE